MMTRDEIVSSIRERAATDPAFRAQLLAEPTAAVSEVVGVPVPSSVRITVHEESPTDVHLVIPAAAALPDEDLELVSGGVWVGSGFC